MSDYLRRDIGDLQAPAALASQLHSTQVEQYIPIDLQYACCYWVQHLRRSEVCLRDDDQVHQFLRKHFLHWLEALSLIREMSDSVRMVTDLESMVVSELADHL